MIEKLSIQLVRYKLPLLIFVAVLAIVFPMVFTSKYVLRIAILCLMYCCLLYTSDAADEL